MQIAYNSNFDWIRFGNLDKILTLDKTADSRKPAKLQYSDLKYSDTKYYGGEINPRMLPSNCPKLLRKLSL